MRVASWDLLIALQSDKEKSIMMGMEVMET